MYGGDENGEDDEDGGARCVCARLAARCALVCGDGDGGGRALTRTRPSASNEKTGRGATHVRRRHRRRTHRHGGRAGGRTAARARARGARACAVACGPRTMAMARCELACGSWNACARCWATTILGSRHHSRNSSSGGGRATTGVESERERRQRASGCVPVDHRVW